MIITYAFPLILAATTIALLSATWFRSLGKVAVFLIATFCLPALAFVAGSCLLVYFIATVGPGDSGEGPAFFGVLGIMLILPMILTIPGALSGCCALLILRLTRRSP